MTDPIYDYYSVDAGVMIRLKDMLPYDLFRPAWDEIARLVSGDRWKIFENVADDVHGDIVERWLVENSRSIVKFNPKINQYMNKLMVELQNNDMMLIDPASLKNNSDPFVIMLALYLEERNLANLKVKGAKTCCILTNEEPKMNKVNIPFVCNYYGIPCMRLFDFMRYHRWHISLDVQNP
jgi:hypothetical protein